MRLSSLSLLLAFSVGGLGSARSARAQETAPSQSTPSTVSVPRTLTLDDAIKQALARNYTVRTTANTARRNDIEVTRAKDNMWLPNVSAGAKWNYTYSLTPQQLRTIGFDTVTTGGTTTFQPIQQGTPSGSHSINYNLGATVNLFNGGSDLARVNAAKATLNSSQNTFTWNKQEIAFNVTRGYLDVLRTGELVDAAQKTLEEGLATLALIQGKYDAGVVPIGQVYQQEAVVGGDSSKLIAARNDFENAKAASLFLMNVPPIDYGDYSFTIAGIDTSTGANARQAIDTSIAPTRINAAIDSRPDIKAQMANIAAFEYDIDATRGQLLPHLDASASIGGSGADADLPRIRFENGLNVGLSLSIPIFDKMQSRLQIQEEEIDVENQKILLEQDVQQLRSDAAIAVNNLVAGEQALDATQASLRAAEESYRLAEERLRVGAGTQVDVIVAEAAVDLARVNWVNAKYNWILAQRQLSYTLGQWNY